MVVLNPTQVPDNIEMVHLLVKGVDDPLPAALMAFTHQSPVPVGIRVAGGCTGMDSEGKFGMLDFFAEGFDGYRGLLSSGGNRLLTEDGFDPMVTDVPAAIIAAQGAGDIIGVSTVPRTEGMGITGDSQFVLSADGNTIVNPGVHMVLIVQSHSGRPLDWDGDLDTYFDAFGSLVIMGGWQLGTVVYNGGGITRKEACRSLALGWPLILIEGSGRAADALIEEYRGGTLDLSDYGYWGDLSDRTILTVNNGDTEGMQNALRAADLLAA